jgi:hypothetical protein
VQTPTLQTSVCVQAFPSLHAVPSATVGLEQTPVDGLHVPATWHWSCSVQVTGLLPLQTPALQLSACVQAFPSLHAVPSTAAGFEQAPVEGLQVPGTWQASWAVQVIGIPALQAPTPSQVSAPLQPLPSLHEVPADTGVCAQTPFVPQLSTVHGLPSSHEAGVQVVPPFEKPS